MTGVQVGFAFALGALTFFAPCAYPLLPGYVAYLLGRDDGSVAGGPRARLGRAAVLGVVASAGVAAVYGGLGAVALAVGTGPLDGLVVVEGVVGVVVVAVGAAMALGRGPSVTVALPARRRSLPGFFLFGAGYALAAAGCTAGVFVWVVGSTLVASPAAGAATLAAYVAGMTTLLVGVTALTALGRDRLLGVEALDPGRLGRAAGVLVVLAGLAQLYLFVVRFDGLVALGLA